jgi:hypothetical protein
MSNRTIPNAHQEPDWDYNHSTQIEEYYQHFPNERPLDPNMPDFAKKRKLC